MSCVRVVSMVRVVALGCTLALALSMVERSSAQNCVQWKQISTTGPARVRPGVAFDSQRGVVVLFGGRSSPGGVHGDTWEWDGATWQLRAVTGPSPREAHAMAYDSVRGVTVLFGGTNGAALGDTWEWDGITWTQRMGPGPSPREQAEMAFDATRGRMVLFGGAGPGPGIGNQTWEWDGTEWMPVIPIGPLPPGPRVEFAMAYDSVLSRVVMFGGYNLVTGASLADTWDWNGKAWTLRVASGPPARYGHAMAYDIARDRLVVVGGVQDQAPPYAFADLWELSGSTWSAAANAGLAARMLGTMCYDSQRNTLVLSNGFWQSNDVWESQGVPPPTIHIDPTSANIEDGRSATLFVIAQSAQALTYQWRKNGKNLSNGGAISGANGPVLTIEPVTEADEGSYDVVVSHTCGSITSAAATLTIDQACPADTNGNGVVDVDDLIAVILGWGACP